MVISCVFLFVFSVATWNNQLFKFNTHSQLVKIPNLYGYFMCVYLFVFSVATWNNHFFRFNTHSQLVKIPNLYGYFMCIFFIFSLWSHGIAFIHSRLVCNFAYGYFMLYSASFCGFPMALKNLPFCLTDVFQTFINISCLKFG